MQHKPRHPPSASRTDKEFAACRWRVSTAAGQQTLYKIAHRVMWGRAPRATDTEGVAAKKFSWPPAALLSLYRSRCIHTSPGRPATADVLRHRTFPHVRT